MKRRTFDASGRVVVRRRLDLSRVYVAGEEVDAKAEELTERQLRVFWEQGLIDTEARVPAPAVPAAQPNRGQQHQHRR
jgi:hypothetical protein